MSLYHEALAAMYDERLPTAWIIDRDHLADEYGDDTTRSAVGVTGPSDAPDELLARLAAGEGVKFKMYDDDGELYFTGRIIALDEDGTDQTFATCGDEFFRPLGDFGTPDSGAVDIRYRDDAGEWLSL